VALTPEPAPVDAHTIDEPEDLGHRPWSPLLATSSAAFRSRSRPTCAACFSPEGTTAPLLGPGQSIWAATGVQVDLLEPIADDAPRAAPVVSQLVRAAVGHTNQADGFRSTSGRVQWSGVWPCGSPGAVCASQAFRTPRVRVNSMSSSPAPFATGLATGVPDMEVCVKVALRHADRFNSSRCIGVRAAMSSTSLNCARDPVTSLAARVTPIESRWRKQQSHLPRFCSLSARTSTCTLRPER
jgi:hypothetical protein